MHVRHNFIGHMSVEAQTTFLQGNIDSIYNIGQKSQRDNVLHLKFPCNCTKFTKFV